MRRHKLTHTGLRQHECQTCQKKFYCRSDLTKHQSAHSNEMPFICRICGTKFAYRWSWRQHERGHQGLKPYLCNVCGKSFTQACTLRGHQKIHDRDNCVQDNSINVQDTINGEQNGANSSGISSKTKEERPKAVRNKKSVAASAALTVDETSVITQTNSEQTILKPALNCSNTIVIPQAMSEHTILMPAVNCSKSSVTPQAATKHTILMPVVNCSAVLNNQYTCSYQTLEQPGQSLIPNLEYAGIVTQQIVDQYHQMSLPETQLYVQFAKDRFGDTFQ